MSAAISRAVLAPEAEALATPIALAPAAGTVPSPWLRLKARWSAGTMRRTTDALEDRMREDVGLPCRRAATELDAALSPLAAAWMR